MRTRRAFGSFGSPWAPGPCRGASAARPFLAKKAVEVATDHDDHERDRENRAQRSDPNRDPGEQERALVRLLP